MEDKLYEKIGRQEVIIEALKRQSSELSTLVARFLDGSEKPSDWSITPKGQLVRKTVAPIKTASRNKK